MEEVRNLLFSFVFPEGVRGKGSPRRFRRWERTVRWPTSCDEEGRSDVEALKRCVMYACISTGVWANGIVV